MNVELGERALERRAVEAVIWGMPAVNYRMMFEASARAGGPGDNQIVYWPGLTDWRNQTLTPNPDVIYLMPFINTKAAGPMVLDIPPAEDGAALNGSLMNYWQTAIEDIGPAGVDAGAGGRCLILPPGFDGDVPAGYLPFQSDTFHCYGLIRSVLRDGSDEAIAQAVAYAERIRLYPLAQAADPPPTDWVDASGGEFDAAIPYDLEFFHKLNEMVQAEPFLARDRLMIDHLRTIGIEQGKSFDPDPATRQILTSAIEEAHAWIDAEYVKLFQHPFTDAGRWALPADPELVRASGDFFAQPDSYPVDARAVAYHWAFTSVKHLGQGQFYLMTIHDSDGQPLDGAAHYKLTIPADAPVTQFWSAIVYNRDTHTLVRHVSRAGRSSQSPGLHVNDDATTDLYFGPRQPAEHESNWIPTDPDGRFEVLFRFYGPTPALHDKTWKLPDLHR